MNKIKIFSLLTVPFTILAFSKPTSAAETLFFDSTDHYLGACQLTDKSTWELKEDTFVTTFQVWYSWNQNENTLPVTLLKDGQTFAKFEATRSSCDPYQKQWCNADYSINKLFPKGTYSTQIPSARQCLKPGGTGAIRLYKEASVSASPTISVTPIITTTPSPTTLPPITTITPIPTPLACPCNQTTTILTAIGASTGISLLINLLFKFLKK